MSEPVVVGEPATGSAGGRLRSREGALVLGLIAVAAVLRLVSIPTRGPWDADQGTELNVLLAWVRDGIVPLLGPPTSIGSIHHGALYYDLLYPAAWISDANPSVVVLTIVAAGIVAVAATWWLARSVAGPVAGFVAATLMAVSATEVAASTFIWNPTLLAAGGALALAGAWDAWSSRRARSWLVAGLGFLIAAQAHILATSLIVPLGLLYLVQLRSADGRLRRALVLAGIGAVAIVAAGSIQLIVHELTTGFSELRGALDTIGTLASGSGDGGGAGGRAPVVAIRILSWPLAGLLVDAPLLALVSSVLVVGSLAWRLVAGGALEGQAMAWLAGVLAWGWLVMTVGVPALGTVVRELPVDHYHAFLDPAVVTILACGIAALARRDAIGRGLAVAGLLVLVGWNLWTQPPLVAPDGGWPAAETAGARILEVAGGHPVAFDSLPDFKSPDAYTFPVARAGGTIVPVGAAPPGGLLAIVCDRAFEAQIAAACGGAAEDARAATLLSTPGGSAMAPVDRFEAAPGRVISLYRVP